MERKDIGGCYFTFWSLIFALIKLPRIWNIAIYRYRWVHIDRYRYTHILWGDNLRERNNQWIKVHWLFPSLGGCQGGRDSWWWILGVPETHVPVLAFCHVGTLWIRHIPQSTRIIVPSRASCTCSEGSLPLPVRFTDQSFIFWDPAPQAQLNIHNTFIWGVF